MESVMSYCYEKERPSLFTETGSATLIKVRDESRKLLDIAGAFAAQKAWDGCTGDSWLMMAALDYLVERGELQRVTPQGSTWAQNAVFIKG
jgi:hypothetical protein